MEEGVFASSSEAAQELYEALKAQVDQEELPALEKAYNKVK